MDASKRKPRQAVVEVDIIIVSCPNKGCERVIPSPVSGWRWDTSELPDTEYEYIVCQNCGQKLTLPTRVTLPNGLGA